MIIIFSCKLHKSGQVKFTESCASRKCIENSISHIKSMWFGNCICVNNIVHRHIPCGVTHVNVRFVQFLFDSFQQYMTRSLVIYSCHSSIYMICHCHP